MNVFAGGIDVLFEFEQRFFPFHSDFHVIPWLRLSLTSSKATALAVCVFARARTLTRDRIEK